MADSPGDAGAPPAPCDLDPSIAPADLDAALRVLAALRAGGAALYAAPALRALRQALASVQPLAEAAKFGGLSPSAYEAKQNKIKAAALARNRARLEDAAFLQKTQLRAGRMQKLAELVASGGEGAQAMPRLLDGAVEAAAPAAALAAAAAEGGGGGGGGGEEGAAQQAAEGGAAAAGAEAEAEAEQRRLHEPRSCYTCKRRFRELHHFYDALCPACAELNWAKRHAAADLHGRIALVTGARVKIGFHVALKLLRCGARVLATSRFPRDTAARFAAQPDFAQWRERLEVFGLDFRDLGALEAFCAALVATLPRLDILINNACQTVRRPAAYYAHLMRVELAPLAGVPPEHARLLQWNGALEAERAGGGGLSALHSGSSDAQGGRERPRLLGATATPASAPAALGAAADGAAAPSAAAGAAVADAPAPASASAQVALSEAQAARGSAALSQVALAREDALGGAAAAALLPEGHLDVNAQQLDLRRHNSWTMVAEEIETPELAEVMAINAMAPFILCARLKGLMQREQGEGGGGGGGGGGAGAPKASMAESILETLRTASSKQERGKDVGGVSARPRRDKEGGHDLEGSTASHGVPAARCRFIVNVSSMEGKFYRAKLPTHPHTNMAKAALNMLTRTSAGEFAERFVYMTAVDTGWINEENPLEVGRKTFLKSGFVTPLDEVDAAARILDPVLEPLGHAQREGGGQCSPAWGSFMKDYHVVEW